MINGINTLLRERPCRRTLLWAIGPVLLGCGVIPDAVASGLIRNGAWAPAAALSLTLITVMMGPKK